MAAYANDLLRGFTILGYFSNMNYEILKKSLLKVLLILQSLK